MTGLTLLYVAIGDKYVREALQAAARCRRIMPDSRIFLYTNASVLPPGVDCVLPAAYSGENPFLMKIRGMRAIEADRFVFLDSDTSVVADISELDRLLENFDIAAAHARIRLQSNIWPDMEMFLADAPECFPEYNTGVIALRRSAALDAMLQRWEELFSAQLRQPVTPRTHDQASFRRALYESGLRVATLPTEYNCRFSHPATVCGPVKILHGRGSPAFLDQVAARVNQQRDYRLILQEGRPRSVVVLPSGKISPGAAAAPAGRTRQE